MRSGSVELPWAIERKYTRAPWEWGWQWVFPATRFYVHPATGRKRRHHLHESVLQKALREAVLRAGLTKAATCHTLRHSLRRICWKTATIFGPSKNYWVTAT